jgi:hypothetical protein
MTLATDKPCSTNTASVTQSNAADTAQPKPNDSARCRHFTADGRRCRLAVLDPRSHLCFRHSALLAVSQPQNDSEDLSAELLPELSQFSSGLDIHKFLARLLILIIKGRISPRRASVMAYVTNQLLHSHRAIARDNHVPAQDERLEFDFSDWPGPPHESGIKGPPCYVRAVLAGHQPDPRSKPPKPDSRSMETNIPLDRPNR